MSIVSAASSSASHGESGGERLRASTVKGRRRTMKHSSRQSAHPTNTQEDDSSNSLPTFPTFASASAVTAIKSVSPSNFDEISSDVPAPVLSRRRSHVEYSGSACPPCPTSHDPIRNSSNDARRGHSISSCFPSSADRRMDLSLIPQCSNGPHVSSGRPLSSRELKSVSSDLTDDSMRKSRVLKRTEGITGTGTIMFQPNELPQLPSLAAHSHHLNDHEMRDDELERIHVREEDDEEGTRHGPPGMLLERHDAPDMIVTRPSQYSLRRAVSFMGTNPFVNPSQPLRAPAPCPLPLPAVAPLSASTDFLPSTESIFPEMSEHTVSRERLVSSSMGFSEVHRERSMTTQLPLRQPPQAPDSYFPQTLPTVNNSKKPHLASINGSTMVRVLQGEFRDTYDHLTIVDCRYPYEYEGGHVDGAVNLQRHQIEQYFFGNIVLEDTVKHTIIFYCEFSSQRGPGCMGFLREIDRKLNLFQYPRLYYPEIYLLLDGYSKFYEFSQVCFTFFSFLSLFFPESSLLGVLSLSLSLSNC